MDRITFRDRIKKMQPRLIKKIENYFLEKRGEEITFGQILNKYCQVGESREIVRQRLIKMTKGELKISDTTLYESILAVVRDHKTNFEFAARRQGNPLAKYRQKEIRKESKKKVITYISCVSCQTITKKEIPLSENPLVGLETFNCPNCETLGEALATVTIDGAIIYKAMRDSEIPGIKTETSISEEEFSTILKKDKEKIIETGY